MSTTMQEAFKAAENRHTPATKQKLADPPSRRASLYYKGQVYSVSIEEIDQEQAQSYLQLNKHNRPLSKHNIERLAFILEREDWVLNGETVVFDKYNVLVNGQHRLAAIVRSGVTMPTFVIRGVDPASFQVTDTCKPRNASDVLAVEKYAHYTTMVGAARCLNAYLLKKPYNFDNMAYSNQSVLEIVHGHDGMRKWASSTHKVRTVTFPTGFATAISYIYEMQGADPERIQEFWNRLVDGVGLTKTSPIYQLRERLFARNNKVIIRRPALYGLCIKCMRAHLLGQSMRSLRTEAEPVIDL